MIILYSIYSFILRTYITPIQETTQKNSHDSRKMTLSDV